MNGMPSMNKQIGTGPKKVRGMAKASLDLIDRMAAIIEDVEPITGRGVGYKLFVAGLIPSMSTNDMKRVYRLLKEAREQGMIPWEWIVDEGRAIERRPSWNDPDHFARSASHQYRRDFWSQQPRRCLVISEKGTVRGILKPVLDELGVGFMAVHGFSSATAVHDLATDDDGRLLIVLYVGDYDPSGLFMSEHDLPNRLAEYGGDHVTVRRIALTRDQLRGLPSFPATDKRNDPRYEWFTKNFGKQCWEIDALDPNALRDRVEAHIRACISDRDAWDRCEQINKAESKSLRTVMRKWASG
jgi:hypothetical protein